MTSFDLEHQRVLAARQTVRRVADELTTERERVDRSFSDLVNGAWTGQAADSFRVGWQEWHTGAQETLGALQGMSDLLAATNDNYLHGDAGASARLAAISAKISKALGG